MRAVDTNVLVRLLVRDSEREAQAADQFISGGAWVSHLVVAEAVWVLEAVYERSPSQLAKAVQLLLDHAHLTLQDADVVAAALNSFRQRPSLGFSDCLILEIARKAGRMPLGTFDRSLAKLAGAVRIDA